MRKMKTALLALAMSAGIAASAFAADGKGISGNVSLSYWMAKNNMSLSSATGASSQKANQYFLPVLDADAKIKNNITIVGQLGFAGSKAITTNGVQDPLDTLKTTKFMIGVKYFIPNMPYYATLSYRSDKMDNSDDNAPSTKTSIKPQGFRVGVGGKIDRVPAPLDASFDAGIGFNNRAKVSDSTGGNASPKVSSVDFTAKVAYQLPKSSLKPFLGYRYVSDKIKTFSLGGTDMTMTSKLKGFFLGAGMSF